MNKFKPLFILLIFALPYFFIFRTFFTSNHLVWGDAPYFYQENLQELFNKPLTWDFRNSNFGLPQFQVLWLYIPTFLMGFLNNLLGLQNDLLIRMVFYFPGTILSFLGSWLFIKHFVKERAGQILGSLLYSFNSYFLVLIDGGQIGITLAYSLFPLVLLSLQNFISTPTIKKFFLATISLTILSNIDIRITVLSLFSLILLDAIKILSLRQWSVINGIFYLLPVILSTLFLDAFWLLPFIQSNFSGISDISQISSSQNFLSLVNGLFLFSPHFPKNEFGQISLVPFYFLLVPLLTYGCLFFKKDKKILTFSLTTLVLIFLLKGRSDPGGFFYGWFLNHFPFAASFRDSSKFFISIMLFSSTLLGLTIEQVSKSLKKQTIWLGIFLISIYTYLFVLIWPAFFGEMSGTLATSSSDNDYQLIYQNLKSDQPFFRTLWFPERPPLAFSSLGKEAISANLLYKDPPFSSMIVGSYDLFYFLHNQELSEWFKLLGIKYAFFPENERKKTWSPKESQNREMFLQFVDSLSGFKKLDWGTSFPGYKVSDPNPKIFGQDKIVLALGGDVYNYLRAQVKDFSLSHQGFVFLEDGISNPNDLLNLPNDSAVLVLKDSNKQDLAMVFLQNKFFGDENLNYTNFGKYSKDQYLDGKNELSNHGLISSDLQFGKGIYFSSETGEKLQLKTNIESGEYRLAFRSISDSNSAGLRYKFATLEGRAKNLNNFTWKISNPLDITKGNQDLEFENLGGFNAINVIAIIPEEDYEKAMQMADTFADKFKKLDPKDLEGLKVINVRYLEINPTRYEIDLSSQHPNWVVFSDHFDKGWKLNGINSQPFYSMINGFLVGSDYDHMTLEYSPQSDVDLGIKISLVSLGMLIFMGLLATWPTLR